MASRLLSGSRLLRAPPPAPAPGAALGPRRSLAAGSAAAARVSSCCAERASRPRGPPASLAGPHPRGQAPTAPRVAPAAWPGRGPMTPWPVASQVAVGGGGCGDCDLRAPLAACARHHLSARPAAFGCVGGALPPAPPALGPLVTLGRQGSPWGGRGGRRRVLEGSRAWGLRSCAAAAAGDGGAPSQQHPAFHWGTWEVEALACPVPSGASVPGSRNPGGRAGGWEGGCWAWGGAGVGWVSP